MGTLKIYDVLEYQDFGFKFDEFEIEIYFEDGTKKVENLKDNIKIQMNAKKYNI